MPSQNFNAQAAEARQQAVAAQAQAATAAREAATAAREQARAQAQMIRDQAQMARDAAQLQREAMRGVISIPPSPRGPSPRQEKMMFSAFVIVVLAAVVIFYPIMRAFARRLEGGARRLDALDAGSAERLQRIEQAVDAMAIEIERISEGQRFTTKLLSSRLETPISLKS
jgi:multidrug efflux pump subunit AcrA (membrane-fusion protein)